MPYYGAGGYYQAGGTNYAAGGLGSFLKKVGRGALNVARSIIPPISPMGMLANAVGPAPRIAGTGPAIVPTPGVTGIMQRITPGGESGYTFAKSRRMNAGNAKAARRAIRRIKSVRHLLQSIERELPRRPAPRGGSRGVITRAEAARALRS